MVDMTCAECTDPILVNSGRYSRFQRVYHPSCYDRMRARLDRENIVVVDPDACRRQLLAAVLRAHAHRVREAHSPEEALWVLAERRAKLVVVDLRLPGAVALIQRVRAETATKKVPIIAVAAAGIEVDQTRSVIDAGASMCCTEPLASAGFHEIVMRLLHAH
jgi:DNA-binding response OmpR family regulator